MRRAGMPGHWSEVPLGQVCLRTELADPTKHPDATFTYVDVSSVSNQSFSIEKTNELTGKEAPSRARKVIRCDDIIFATVRPTLRRIALVPRWLDGQICSTGYCVVRPDSLRLLPAYAYFYLLSQEVAQRVEGMQKGATYPAISDADLLSLSIPLPPLPEQRAIAHVLRAVQTAREARQREVALERERKAALMAHLFAHGTRGEPTKQTPIGEMPESWEVKPLGNIVTFRRGVDLPVQARNEGQVPVIGSNGIVGFHSCGVDRAPIPGLVTGRSGSIGLLTYMETSYWPLNTALYVTSFHDNLPLFLYYWLQMFDFARYSQGVSVPTLNRNLIHPVPFRLPPFEEQRQIAGVLGAGDAKIAALERESTLLDELFRALLAELMTGRLSATEASGHDAS